MDTPIPATRHSILLVDDDPDNISNMAQILRELGQLRFATTGQDALCLARQSAPDLVFLDVEMPGMNGFQVCEAMKKDPLLVDVPIIFITAHSSMSDEVAGLRVGAADFISKPPRPPLVIARARTHLRMRDLCAALRHSANTDVLTGLCNRRQFDESLPREWLRGERNGSPISLMMIDVDHFKLYNDHYGHPAGDRCLATVAQAIRQVVRRPADLLARYGGEEFVLLLPNTDSDGARHMAVQALESVEALRLPHEASPVTNYVTISVGVSTYDKSCRGWPPPFPESRGGEPLRRPPSDLVDAADRALYAAKAAGRRQVWFLGIDHLKPPEPVTARPAPQWPPAPLNSNAANA